MNTKVLQLPTRYSMEVFIAAYSISREADGFPFNHGVRPETQQWDSVAKLLFFLPII